MVQQNNDVTILTYSLYYRRYLVDMTINSFPIFFPRSAETRERGSQASGESSGRYSWGTAGPVPCQASTNFSISIQELNPTKKSRDRGAENTTTSTLQAQSESKLTGQDVWVLTFDNGVPTNYKVKVGNLLGNGSYEVTYYVHDADDDSNEDAFVFRPEDKNNPRSNEAWYLCSEYPTEADLPQSSAPRLVASATPPPISQDSPGSPPSSSDWINS